MQLTPEQANRLKTWIADEPPDAAETLQASPGAQTVVAGHAASSASAAPVARVGAYHIERSLGRGGMGEVFVALDERLQRRVALKSIRAERKLDAEARDRFLREARVLSSLDHPHICRIYDYLESPTGDYLVLELIDGMPLGRWLSRLSTKEKLRVAEQIADVLATAHAAGIVHRDLKPDNVMLTSAFETKVLDFGLARFSEGDAEGEGEAVAGDAADDQTIESIATAATQSLFLTRRDGVVAGTPLYMSPEQARGETVSAASDLYSFGLMLQEMFTGERPYPEGLELEELLERARLGRTRPVTGASRGLRLLIEQLKTVEPKGRLTASETAARLRRIIDAPRRRVRNAVIAAGFALAVVAGVKYTVDLERERSQAVAARDDAEDLLTFMLGDLKDRLEPVGRLDVMDAVGDKALEYFSRLPERDLGDDDRHRRARALTLIGQVRLGQGDLEAAEEAFGESLALATGVVKRNPDNAEWIKGLGDSHFYIGNIRYLSGDMPGALQKFNDYRAITDQLVAIDATNPEWQVEQAYAHQNLGVLHLEHGDLEQGLRESEAAIAIKRRLVASDPAEPKWQRTLGNSLSWRATALWNAGDPAAARGVFDEELSIRSALHEANPNHADDAFKAATCIGLLGALVKSQGQTDEAIGHYRRMRQQLTALVALDPANTRWRRELAVSHRLTAEAQRSLGRVDEAIAELRSGRDILVDLVDREPEMEDWRVELAQFKRGLFAIAYDRRQWSEATDAARAAIDLLAPLAESEAVGPSARSALANAHVGLGKALGKLGDTEGALAACEAGRAALGVTSERLTPREWGTSVLCETVIIRLLEDAGREGEALERSRALQRRVGDAVIADPDDGDRVAELIASHCRVARGHRRLGQLDAALVEASAARDIAIELAARASVLPEWTLRCVAARRELMTIALRQERWKDALTASDEAMELLEPMMSGDGPTPEVRVVVGGIILRRGVAVHHMDGPGDARELWKLAIDTVEPAVESTQRHAARAIQARALLRLGRRDEAGPIIDGLESTDEWNDVRNELAHEDLLSAPTG